MLARCRALLTAPAPTISGRDAHPALAVGQSGPHEQTKTAALDAFDRLRVREVRVENSYTASTFLAKFRSTAASLGPEEWIKLVYTREDIDSLRTVLADPQASKICALLWVYNGEEDVNSVIPLLTNSCPELASLEVGFKRHSVVDFVSSVLKRPGNKIKVLHMPYTEGDFPRFFAALEQSQVSAFTLFSGGSSEFYQGLSEYLTKDLLVRLTVRMSYQQVPSEVVMSLANCTRLAELKMMQCTFSQSPTFPKSITKLALHGCEFVGCFDWSFLADSNVRELDFFDVEGVDGTQLASALAVRLREKGLDELRFSVCDFVNQTLAAVGLELGRIKRLDLEGSNLNDASIALIALTLQSSNSELRELVLPYDSNTASRIENHLGLALRHPNCSLAKLSLSTSQWYRTAVKVVEDRFHNRRALFVLLQGRQGRRKSPLRRLPVEMFRMVGEVLL